MAGFKKAKAEQAALKVGIYGPAGSGKTFTALLFAEGLAKLSGKRIAMIDTENGGDFYCQPVKERTIHPEEFDYDVVKTKSVTTISEELFKLNPNTHCAIIIDSMTHVWEACINAYSGNKTRVDTIPMHAWGKIKKPYKDLISFLLSSPMHVFICGRQGNEFEEDDDTGKLRKIGTKMKAEGETAYEPHILLKMDIVRGESGIGHVSAFAEKDRTGVLSGKTFDNPTFDMCIKPLLPLLGGKQARQETADEVAAKDAEAIDQKDLEKEAKSEATLNEFKAKITLAKDTDSLKELGKLITAELKSQMLTAHVTELRQAYLEAEKKLK